LRIALLFLILICFFQNSFSQIIELKILKPKVQQEYKKVNDLAAKGNLGQAMVQLDKILKKHPNFIDGIFLKAALYFDMDNFSDAISWYNKGLSIHPTPDPAIFYQIAVTHYRINQFPIALSEVNKFLTLAPANHKWKQRAIQLEDRLSFIVTTMNDATNFEPKPLPGYINTKYNEYLPSLTADEKYLVYTKRFQGQEDLFFSIKDSTGLWSEGQPLEFNTPDNEGAQTISADGKLIVFTACNRKDGFGGCDLYFTERIQNEWTVPKNMGKPINSSAWESQPSLSANGTALYFASTRPGGFGGSDIWVSYRQNNRSWSTPIPLDSTINTTSDDQSPFIHADNKTLYFMSKGHKGMGEFDLFMSKKDSDGNWSTPLNLGYPINTPANEGAIVISLDAKTAFFDSDKEGNSNIYTFELPEKLRPTPVTYLRCIVKDASTHKTIQADVLLTDLSQPTNFYSIPTHTDGSFLICLPLGTNYALQIEKQGYLFHSENFSLSDITGERTIFEMEVNLYPTQQTSTPEIILKNIFFNTGSAELIPTSFPELNLLIRLLLDNQQMRIQINGHTDDVGSEEDNLILSEKRAFSVYSYLLEQGIDPNRLGYKGFGESKPISTNRAENRRTSFEILPN
jgi:outer membrane protein OmpA-like peptidoglycan-associated protein